LARPPRPRYAQTVDMPPPGASADVSVLYVEITCGWSANA
jgi:hypothetical protein